MWVLSRGLRMVVRELLSDVFVLWIVLRIEVATSYQDCQLVDVQGLLSGLH